MLYQNKVDFVERHKLRRFRSTRTLAMAAPAQGAPALGDAHGLQHADRAEQYLA